MNINKEYINYVNSVFDFIKNLGIIIAIIYSLLFFIFPKFEIFIRDKILTESAYFYIGKWNIINKSYEKDMQYSLNITNESDYDKDTGLIKKSNVLITDSDMAIGRTEYGTKNGIRKLILNKYDCIYILESKALPIDEINNAIWVRALPKPCKN